MIFVTVGGGHYYGFNRLVEAMDRISRQVACEVVIQNGCSSFIPKYANYFKFTEMGDMLNYYKRADVVVAHASGAPIMYAKDFNIPIILVPRMPQYGEIFDEHQYKTAKRMESYEMVESAYDIKDIPDALSRAFEKKNKKWIKTEEKREVIKEIKNFVKKAAG